jgi:peptidoglycan-associated lipoprotein
MPQRLISRIFTMALLSCVIVAPVMGCSKRVASSTGEAASASKGKSAPPVETINPESMATVPGSGTFETAREGESAREPTASVPPAATPSAELLSLEDIFFDFDQHTIRRDAQATLSANAAWINSKPGKAIVIEGHCDERGTQAYNLVLGDKRARSTKRYLEDLGVPSSRLKTTSYGELRPFCKERDEVCYQQNRRAHFVVQ